jgi:[acyl-carrier-protein] S-malonyltransferase
VPLELAPDCAELAGDTTMGVLFTREPVLEEAEVHRVCRSISAEGRGLIGPSAFLSPNTALILGQGDTLDRLEACMRDHFPGRIMLRRNANRWPPLHSPIVWEKNIPNRTASMMYRLKGGTNRPRPDIISLVTGEASYDAENSRDLMIRWADQPQRLWDAIETLLNAGAATVIHVGPSPNLIPATFGRLSNNVTKHLQNKHLQRIGNNVVTTMGRHAWLAHMLPAKACLLRTPFIEHIILEDWLLAQPAA